MAGRDQHELHRSATPLELLFDLTFVAAFAVAANQLAHAMAEDHLAAGVAGFMFASFGICWAWINFSWFASAYDTDDWVYRLTTMVQMGGVLVLAIGLPAMFGSIGRGEGFDNRVLVLGYVIMRVAMVFQWIRASRQDPARRRTCLIYAGAISIAQLGWIAQMFTSFSIALSVAVALVLILVELVVPMIAERREGGTPWHAHHIAERYGLLVIIALGEGIIGTVAALSAVVESVGWSPSAGMVCFAGLALTLGMWWIYFMLPSAEVLHRHRDRSFVWGYGQMILVAAIVATGAGLHAAAYLIEGKSKAGSLATALYVIVPFSIFLIGTYLLYSYLARGFDKLHGWLIGGTCLVIGAALAAVLMGASMPACLLILTLAPAVSIIGYEWVGHRHQADMLAADAASLSRTMDS